MLELTTSSSDLEQELTRLRVEQENRQADVGRAVQAAASGCAQIITQLQDFYSQQEQAMRIGIETLPNSGSRALTNFCALLSKISTIPRLYGI